MAERLGLLLVKVNGPALGSEVTSLDPAQAPHATARQELEKINLALKTGSNTLLYVDDIQHTAPGFLEKFIPLCDGTRRVEGVWEGAPHTYDLRGKRFAVCMAGNPYTGSGSRFRIPDMLANRADVWNLGEVLTGKQDAFALSFVENALTSHPVLAPLAARPRADIELLVALARGASEARADRLSHPCPPAELDRILAVLRHVLAVRETVLAVNRAYIASAGQTDATRTEPPFRLQGSYRTMNKIVQRVQPVMNDAELGALVEDHFTAEAQTLTADAEANLLKLAELRGVLDGDRACGPVGGDQARLRPHPGPPRRHRHRPDGPGRRRARPAGRPGGSRGGGPAPAAGHPGSGAGVSTPGIGTGAPPVPGGGGSPGPRPGPRPCPAPPAAGPVTAPRSRTQGFGGALRSDNETAGAPVARCGRCLG